MVQVNPMVCPRLYRNRTNPIETRRCSLAVDLLAYLLPKSRVLTLTLEKVPLLF